MTQIRSEVAQSCPTLWSPMGGSLPGSFIHGIFQERVLGWVAISFSSGSSLSRDWTHVSHIAGRLFTIWATREALKWKWKSLSHVWFFVIPGTTTVHGILQARILEWVAVPFSRGSSQPREVSICISNIAPREKDRKKGERKIWSYTTLTSLYSNMSDV